MAVVLIYQVVEEVVCHESTLASRELCEEADGIGFAGVCELTLVEQGEQVYDQRVEEDLVVLSVDLEDNEYSLFGVPRLEEPDARKKEKSSEPEEREVSHFARDVFVELSRRLHSLR